MDCPKAGGYIEKRVPSSYPEQAQYSPRGVGAVDSRVKTLVSARSTQPDGFSQFSHGERLILHSVVRSHNFPSIFRNSLSITLVREYSCFFQCTNRPFGGQGSRAPVLPAKRARTLNTTINVQVWVSVLSHITPGGRDTRTAHLVHPASGARLHVPCRDVGRVLSPFTATISGRVGA